MSWEYELKAYLREIDRHLGHVDKQTKRSIRREVEEHLRQKVKDTMDEMNTRDLTTHQFRRILIAFGDPEEISKQYLEAVPSSSLKKGERERKKPWSVLFSITLAIGLIVFMIWMPADDDGNDGKKDDDPVMPDGPWFQGIDWSDHWGGAVAVSWSDGVFVYNGSSMFKWDNYPEGSYTGVSWHPNESKYVVTGADGTIRLSNSTGEHDLSIPVFDDFQEVEYHPSGEYALAVGARGLMAVINETNVSHGYIPDDLTSTDFYDTAWDPVNGSAIMVGYEREDFMKGSIIEYIPAGNDTINGTFFELDLPADISTCFGIEWIEEWSVFVVVCNSGQIYTIDENRTIVRINNTLTGQQPLLDVCYVSTEDSILIVGGNSGWNSYLQEYQRKFSRKVVLRYDGENLTLIEDDIGPHLQLCEWSPVDEHVIMLGSFGSSWTYKDGIITDLDIEDRTR